ncbi:TonB-dependent receptor [Shewanella piezotolerans WP3]|uniref:TonB-dependent receptor n=1 Tax=Shewanella piezotolerans (strain WP3 / JCM 13877) TaxID=225849 RepID=B8CTL9_SHEPW|nr:TonB-dependent receptor [Shewanella piezotolerans]ACJ31263.1 TonB-dependent receptor [Shewanella piezotolerans WP3]
MTSRIKRTIKNNKFLLTPIASAVCLILNGTLNLAVAAETEPTEKPVLSVETNQQQDEEVEVIHVRGIVSSLKEAQNIKKMSDNIVDAIVAEDIGQFPDQNVAESLQRIPGVSVTRVDGEGQKVTIRGLSGKYNVTTFNGRKLASDSQTRDFNYDVIASELVGKIEVHKTQQAKLQEGAVGGVVNIYSRKPLDVGQSLVLSVEGEYNERAESTNPKTSLIMSDVFNDGTFGALASFVHSKRTSRYDAYSSSNWDDWQYNELHHRSNPNNIEDTLPEGAAINDTFRMPNWPRVTSTESERERFGGTVAFQWLIGDNLDINLDGLYSSYDVDNRSKAMTVVMPNVYSSSATYTDFNAGPDGFLADAAWNDATVELLETGVPRKSDTYQVGLNANWLLDEVTLNFDASISKAKNEDDGNGNLVVVRAGVDGAAINFNNGSSIPDISLSQPLDQNAKYGAHHSRRYGDSIEDEIQRFVVDGTWEPSEGIVTAVYFGSGYTSEQKDRQNYYPNSPSIFALDHMDDVNPTFDAPTIDIGGQTMWQLPSNVIIPGSSNSFAGGASLPSAWPSINVDNLFNYFQTLDPVAYQELLPQANAKRGNTYGVKEETVHAYLEAKLEEELFGLPYMLDLGVRYIKTDVTAYGYSHNPANLAFNSDGTLANDAWKDKTLVEYSGDYSEVLPSMNFKINLHDDVVLRLAAAKAISRPFLSQLTPKTNISPELDGGSAGKEKRTMYERDPGLAPYTSKQFDTSLEWYYSDDGNLAFATFFKKFENTLEDKVTSEVIAGQDFSVTRSYNSDNEALIRGYELAWYQTFDAFLPHSLAGFGVAGNYTYNNSTSGKNDSEGDEIPFFGLSEHQVNLNLFYEIEDFSINAAYNYRSDYTVRDVSHWTYETFGSVTTEQATAPAWDSLSISLKYDITDNLQLSADAYNLLDPEEYLTVNAMKTELLTAGASSAQYGIGSSSYGRSYALGLRYTF